MAGADAGLQGLPGAATLAGKGRLPHMKKDRMSPRERFHATFSYGSPDRVFRLADWRFNDTMLRWRKEGLPSDEHFSTQFGFDRVENINLNPGYSEDLDAVWPRPSTRVVERSLEWHVVENELGGRYRTWTDREIGMSQWIDFPVKDRQSWERFKRWLDPDQPSRYPEYWDDLVRCYKDRDYPLGITAGSYYGWLRDWVGMENLALWYYDRPDLVREIVEYVADFVIRWTSRALSDIPDIDFASIWEDMCMKTGPLISPDLYRTFHLEPMRRVIKVFREAGVRLVTLDSDGMADELIPIWLDAGVDVVYPIERASGCDPVRYRARHGKKLRMYGGIDKRVLRDGMPRTAIEDEVAQKVGLIREGGYIPLVDHAIPPDVPLANYRYYRHLVDEACSLP
jgi:hypothetical protein